MRGLLLILIAAPVVAGEPLKLEEITVAASRADAVLPARTVVERDEITASRKSELGDVLELTPGVNLRDGGRGAPRLDVRGFDQRAVLLTLDGVPVYEPWNGIVNLTLFPLEMLDAIESRRGPTSSLFGPNGMAGAITMSSLGPQPRPRAAAGTIWRDSSTWDARASAAGSTHGIGGAIAGRYCTSPGFPLPGEFDDRPATQRRYEDGGQRLNSDREVKSLFANVGYDYADSGRARVTVLGSTSSFGVPPSTTAFRGPFLRNAGEDLWHVQGGVDHRLTPSLGAAAAVFYTSYRIKEREFTGPDFGTKLVTRHAESDEVGGIGRLTLDVTPRAALAVAMQGRQAGAHVFDDTGGPRTRPEVTTASLAAENRYRLGDRIALVAGLSLDVQGGARDTRWEPNPQGGVSVDWGRYGLSRVAISRKVRFPTLRELVDPQQGNADLRPERALVYEIGHAAGTPWGDAALSLFRSDVDDMISNSGGERSHFVNSQDATLQGVEVAGGTQPLNWLRLDANYTYLDTQASNPSRSGSAHSDVQHRPPHRFNGILHVFLPFDVTLRLEGIYTGEQLDRFGTSLHAGAYGLFNVQVTKYVGRRLEIFAGTDNILDTYHQDKLGTPGAGRWVFSGLRGRYE